MKKAIQRLFPLFLLCLALTLSGCQATPQGVEEAGTMRAMTDAEQTAAQAIANIPQADSYQVFQEDGRQLDLTFGEGDRQLVIRASVQVPQLESVNTYTLVESMPDQEALVSTFFSQSERVVEVEPVWCDTQLRADMGGTAVGTLQINVEGVWPFRYTFDDGLPSAEAYDMDTPPSSVQIDPAVAEAELDRIAQGLGLYGVTMDYYVDIADRRNFDVYPNYTPFDVAPILDRDVNLGIVGADFSSQHLTKLIWSSFMTIEDAQPAENLLSLDEAIAIASQYLDDTLQPLSAAPFTHVSLRVRYQRDVTKEDAWIARPVWYFSTGNTSSTLRPGPGGYLGSYTSSFAVDAQTGILETRTAFGHSVGD